MKKIFVMGMFAVAAAAFSQQPASAWINTRFSVGMNFGWQAGGNSVLWGAVRGAQPGGPELPNCRHSHQGYYGYGCPMAPVPFTPPAPTPSTGAAPATIPQTIGSPAWFSYPGYQTVNYAPDFWNNDFSFIP